MPRQPDSTEEELIRQCATGDLKCQEMLYKKFYGFAMGVSIRYSLNREDALEVVNDSFIKLFHALHTYDPDRPFRPWLSTLVIHTAIDRRRRELKYQSDLQPGQALMLMSSSDTIGHLQAAEILELLKLLPLLQATVFNLYEVDGYSHDEIGQLLGIAASSSRVYLTRAKDKLRKILSIIMHHERRSVR
jgi:RNA polymerase sigma factor (sigma-70 family)